MSKKIVRTIILIIEKITVILLLVDPVIVGSTVD
jgi:hypothetical protein